MPSVSIKATTIRIKEGGRLPKGLEASEVLSELTRIRALNGQLLTAHAVWENSRKASAPLYACFTWDVKKAAEKCWDQEARDIIQHIEIVDDVSEKSTRAWYRVVVDGESGYMPTAEVLIDETLKEQVLEAIRRDLVSARKRLSDFEGFSAECEDLDRIIRKMDVKVAKKPS